MKSFISDNDVTQEIIAGHEARTGTSVERKRQYRAQQLDLNYQVAQGADQHGPELEFVFKGDVQSNP